MNNIQSMIQENYKKRDELNLNDRDYKILYESLDSFIKEQIWYYGIVDEMGINVDEMRKSEPTTLITSLIEVIQKLKLTDQY